MKPASSKPLDAVAFERLAGRWRLDRTIPEAGASLTGEARFDLIAPGRALYHETGSLRLATGGVFSAYRSYLYTLEAGGMVVDFADGPQPGDRYLTLSPFLETASGLEARGRHDCGADAYEATYRLADPNRLLIEVAVVGPRKRLRILSDYRRYGAR